MSGQAVGLDMVGHRADATMGAAAGPSPPAAEVNATTLEAGRPRARGSFHAVATFHVLEQLQGSDRVPAAPGRALLRPGGQIFIEVPNGGSVGARRDQERWYHAVPQDHVTLPTRAR